MQIALAELPKQSLEKHVYFHHPKVNDRVVLPVPYLTLPFRRRDVTGSLKVSEGWDYSRREKGITGYEDHRAVDYADETGTPVYAPCRALAIASYHTHLVTRRLGDNTREVVTFKGEPVNSGLGLFVQLYVPELDRYLQLGHLNSVSEAIPFSEPVPDEEHGWLPTNYNLPPELITSENPKIVVVQRGDFLGTVGTSGLTLGYEEYDGKTGKLSLYPPSVSWDIPHLHMIESGRRRVGDHTEKTCARDMYDLYEGHEVYPTDKTVGRGRRRGLGPEPLFHLDERGLPLYADD